MKGCLITILVLGALGVLVLGGGTCYFGLQLRDFFEDMRAGFEEARATDAAFPFTATAGTALDRERVAAFLAIRRAVVEPTLETLQRVRGPADGEKPGLRDAFATLRAMRGAITQLPRLLAASLREHEMGFSEYRWITEVTHGTLAGADRSGDHPRATALVERFEDFFDKDERGMNAAFDAQQYDYPALRHRLERDYRDFRPDDLALILEHEQALQDPLAQVMLDVVVLQRERDE